MPISDGFNDPLDSPGYYQLGSAMGPMPIDNSRAHVRYFYSRKRDKRNKNNRIYFVLMRGENLYIRRRWWGGFQTTGNRNEATIWEDAGKAMEWAAKRGLR